jgi:hypothetical protein
MKARTNHVEGLLAFAEALRNNALAAGCDLNAANLMVHTILWRDLVDEESASEPHANKQDILDEVDSGLGLFPLAA